MVERVRAQRQRVREIGNRGPLSAFVVGDYVLVARVRKLGSAPKLVPTWTGPWRVLQGGSTYDYVVEDIVMGKTKEVHVVRMRAYADSSLITEAEVKGGFEISKHQGASAMADVVDVGTDPDRPGEYRVQVTWVGLEDKKPT